MRFYFDLNILIEIRNDEMRFCSMIWQLFVARYIQFFLIMMLRHYIIGWNKPRGLPFMPHPDTM